uniref:restriction endonuclease subunit S n=1 Tax=Mycoplasma leonicaptivi TaxID=36742 RepID=UPI0004802060
NLKIKKLENVKKELLQKMFADKDDLVPKIRFDGFEDEWEEKKFSELIKLKSFRNTDLFYKYDDVFSVSNDYGIVNQIKFLGRSFAGESLQNYKVVEPTDIVYTKSPLTNFPYGIIRSNNSEKTGIVSVLYAVYESKPNFVSNFMELYFTLSYRINNFLYSIISKGAKNTINISDRAFFDKSILVPNLQEQQKIAKLFTTLDNVIKLNKQKLEKLQNIKKTLLQKMFV